MVHLVYCDNTEKVLPKIIDGSKTMVIRSAMVRKIPHSRVFEGEKLYFMEKGTKNIYSKAVVTQVHNYVKLTDEEISQVLLDNQPKLLLTNREIKRWSKKCICLVEFSHVEVIPTLTFQYQSNMDDWLIIDKIEDVLVGTSVPHNYEKSRFK